MKSAVACLGVLKYWNQQRIKLLPEARQKVQSEIHEERTEQQEENE